MWHCGGTLKAQQYTVKCRECKYPEESFLGQWSQLLERRMHFGGLRGVKIFKEIKNFIDRNTINLVYVCVCVDLYIKFMSTMIAF